MLLIIGVGLSSCSTQKLLKKHRYAELIKEANSKLDEIPDDRHAGKLLRKTYQKALVYYQGELDKTGNQDDRIKHKKMLDLMMKMDTLSELIRKNLYALQFVPNPKNYSKEITNITPLAVEELYAAGTDALNKNSREKAKEAFNFFHQLVQLNPEYKDVKTRITEAKNIATVNIILDDVQFYLNTLNLSAEKFQKELLYRLQSDYPYLGFLNFYSSDEALKYDVNSPEFVVKLEIHDFDIDRAQSGEINSGTGQLPTEENTDSSSRITVYRTSFKAMVTLQIFSTQQHKIVFRDQIPCMYWVERSSTSNSGRIHQLTIGPESQKFFNELFASNLDNIVDYISAYLEKYQ